MDLVKIIIAAIASLLLGVLGGFAARSLVAGIVLGVFVFVGWFLWMQFQQQRTEEKPKEEEPKA
jgi:uncharacterized protein (DUF2062 family)